MPNRSTTVHSAKKIWKAIGNRQEKEDSTKLPIERDSVSSVSVVKFREKTAKTHYAPSSIQ